MSLVSPLRILSRGDNVAIAHVNDTVANPGSLWVMSDHQDRLPELAVGLPQHL
jgi:hypothetical protein